MVTPSVTVGYRDNVSKAVTYSSAKQANSLGYCPLRTNARYHRFKVTIPAGSTWTIATGIDDIKYSPMGAR
jgi:hypothetical protein